MKYIAQIEESGQVTEDSWKVFKRTLEVTPETTVQQILDWSRGKWPIEIIEVTPAITPQKS